MEIKQVSIYTDGACSGNPGPGGYAVVLIYQDERKEICGGCSNTTNNRMELLAAIKGLEALEEKCQVTLYSDSKYLIDSLNQGWVSRWQANKWMRNKHAPAPNVDLWERLLKLGQFHQVEYQWVKGHSDNKELNRCDYLAVQASKQSIEPLGFSQASRLNKACSQEDR
jgi:ribonuclease HI